MATAKTKVSETRINYIQNRQKTLIAQANTTKTTADNASVSAANANAKADAISTRIGTTNFDVVSKLPSFLTGTSLMASSANSTTTGELADKFNYLLSNLRSHGFMA